MRQRILIAATALTVAAASVIAQDNDFDANEEKLLELIERNAGGLTRALIIPSGELEPSMIWIHIRTPDQREEAAKIAELLYDGIQLGRKTRGVQLQPVQTVAIGPGEAQVRFFKPEDRATANEIARTLADADIPAQPVDFIEAFRDASYIQSGHIEIWLDEGASN